MGVVGWELRRQVLILLGFSFFESGDLQYFFTLWCWGSEWLKESLPGSS